MLALCTLGVADSAYLFLNSVFSSVPLICPTTGIINCGEVTSSAYSHLYGVPVALLALGWFLALSILTLIRPSFTPYLIFPLWAAGITMIGYLISVELFILHAICLYCTLAHVCAALLGVPVYRLTFRE